MPPLSESRGYFQRRPPVQRWLRRQERSCCERLTTARPLHRPFLAPAFVILVGARERQGRVVGGQACVQGRSGCLRTEEPGAAWPARVCSAFLRRGQNRGTCWKPPSGNKSKVWRGARPMPQGPPKPVLTPQSSGGSTDNPPEPHTLPGTHRATRAGSTPTATAARDLLLSCLAGGGPVGAEPPALPSHL